MKYIASYKTGRTRADGKPETAIYYHDGKAPVMSFPAKLNNYKMVDLREVAAILRGESVMLSEGYHVIRSQAIGPDWTAEQAILFIKDFTGETLIANAQPGEPEPVKTGPDLALLHFDPRS